MEIKAKNKLDFDYLSILNDIIENGNERDTRAGKAKSLFGKQLRIDLTEGFPLLTTKKIFTRGAIHELLWFLNKDAISSNEGFMNIKYLVENNVHIWDDDAFRWYHEWIDKNLKSLPTDSYEFYSETSNAREYWNKDDGMDKEYEWLVAMPKEFFLKFVIEDVEIRLLNGSNKKYKFGNLGRVYGAQWRDWKTPNGESIDQVQNLINKLKTNPTDRRLIISAYNVGEIDNMALPPCHVMSQFYTRELSLDERWEEYKKRIGEDSVYKDATNSWLSPQEREPLNEELERRNIPRYALSCMWSQRSCDYCVGVPINIASYALLTHMIASVVNMVPSELIGSFGDCHVYMNHIDGAIEQLSREGYENLPRLEIGGEHNSIDDFKFEDFKIIGYESDSKIKFPLNVG